MIITICGSMEFAREMIAVGVLLQRRGHQVLYPEYTLDFAKGSISKQEGAKLKKSQGLIRAHYQNIASSNAILVLNYDKGQHRGWVGANSFLEMGFAHVLSKRIYLLNPPPEFPYFNEELQAMQAIVLNGDLSKIGVNG